MIELPSKRPSEGLELTARYARQLTSQAHVADGARAEASQADVTGVCCRHHAASARRERDHRSGSGTQFGTGSMAVTSRRPTRRPTRRGAAIQAELS